MTKNNDQCKQDAVIEVKDLEKQYENGEIITKVLHGVNFRVNKGEFLAIMGPSGSGWTHDG